MKTEKFGLGKSPFRGVSAVYAGPQQLALAGGLKRALSAPDAVVTVAGAAGTGKTISVRHALARLGGSPVVARIGRVYLQRDEILELLLDEFGVVQKPAGSLQKFAAYKRLVRNWNDAGTPVVIVVEDAVRLGADALAELESLTADDSDDFVGTNLVLQGDLELARFLKQPVLARLRQRIRRNFRIEPFSREETRDYLTQRVAHAGGRLEDLFEAGVVDLVHTASEGVARVINSLGECLLLAAEEAGSSKVGLSLARRVTRDEFGIEAAAVPVPTGDGDPADTNAGSPEPARRVETGIPHSTQQEPGAGQVDDDDGIPELIQDTQPRIPSLAGTDGGRNTGNAAGPGSNFGQSWDELRARLEPRAPEPLSKSVDPADSQEVRALDDALTPDTQFLQTLDAEPVPLEDDAPVPLGLREAPAAAESRTPSPASRPADGSALRGDANDETSADQTSSGDSDADSVELPTLSDTVTMKALSANDIPSEALPPKPDGSGARSGDGPLSQPAAGVRREATPTDASTSQASPDAVANEEEDAEVDTAVSLEDALEDEAASVDCNATDNANESPAGAPGDASAIELALEDTAESMQAIAGTDAETDRSCDDLAANMDDSASDGELPNLSLVPEITLDASLEEHQQQAQSKLAEEAARLVAARTTPQTRGDEEATDDRQDSALAESELGEDESDAERQKRLAALAERFSNARSIEDIVDDTAAETLFGEEFSQIAAAVTALHEAGQQADAAGAAAVAASNDDSAKAPGETRPENAPKTATASASAVAAARQPGPAKPARQAPATARQAGAARGAFAQGGSRPAADAAGRSTPTRPAARPTEAADDLSSSAARRLEMVRALNKKAGRPAPKIPSRIGEEIVLGDGDRGTPSSAPRPEPIESQFGESMTAKLRALSEENIRKMEQAEQAEEARQERKRGFLSRFKRSS